MTSKVKYSKNEPVFITGVTSSDDPVKVFIIDSDGKQFHSFVQPIIKKGSIEITYDYDFFTPGTYFLYAFQGNAVDILKFGVGQYPQQSLSLKLNKTNYFHDDVALIAIYGNPSDLLTLELIDNSGNSIFVDKITLGSEGKTVYRLNIRDLPANYYSVIISKGSIKATESFTIDFHLGFNSIDYDFTKTSYFPNDLVDVYGATDPKTGLTFLLIDPSMTIINQIESFSNSDGTFSMSNFKIPLDPNDGKWILHISSGTNSKNIFFNVVSTDTMFTVHVSEIKSTSYGQLVLIEGKNATPEKSVIVSIRYKNSYQSWDLPTKSTVNGDYSVLWLVPKDAMEGNYIVKSQDALSQYSETSFKR